MRILFVNDHARVTGGADVHSFDLARLLRADGHEVAFLSTRHAENLETEGRFVPLTVTRAARDHLPIRDTVRAASFSLWNPQAARATEELVDTFRPDVVHAHKLYPQLSVAPIVVARRRRVPIVQTIHDYEFVSASLSDHTGSWLDRQESRLSYRSLNTALFAVKQKVHRPAVAEWITVSRHMADTCRRVRGIEPHVIANFAAAPSGPVPGYEARDGVLFLGRLAPEKGVRDLLQLARENQDLRIAIAGDGELAGEVAAAATELPSLSFLGTLTPQEVRSRLEGARLLVVPSRWQEPAGLVSLEAMAAGTPIVAYDSGGLAEYVTDGGGGVVVEPDPRALSEGIRSLQDRTRWEERSRHGREAAATIYSPPRYVAEVLGIYRSAQAAVGPRRDA